MTRFGVTMTCVGQIYGWQTFKRIGASLTINRVYKLVLSLSIAIQLSLFFIFSAMALWVDQLYHAPIGRLSAHLAISRAGFIIVVCVSGCNPCSDTMILKA